MYKHREIIREYGNNLARVTMIYNEYFDTFVVVVDVYNEHVDAIEHFQDSDKKKADAYYDNVVKGFQDGSWINSVMGLRFNK